MAYCIDPSQELPQPPSPISSTYSSTTANNPHWFFLPMIDAIVENPSPGTAVPALLSLCDSLMFSSDEELDFFPVELAAKFLVDALLRDGLCEEYLLAARGIVYFCDSMPDSTESVVEWGAIPALCARLKTMDYLELAEQRTALHMVENTCKCVLQEDASLVINVVQVLCTMLRHQDPTVSNTAASSMVGFATSFSGSSYFFDELCKCGVIKSTLDVIALGCLSMCDREGKNDLVELLIIAASCSLEVIKLLLELRISSILTKFLPQMTCYAEAKL